jgi:hypothetical protein
MPDDLMNPILFYFFCGTLDVFFTIIVLFTNIGIEANPVWNWITPKETLAIIIVAANLLFCLFLMLIIPYVSKHKFWHTAITFGLYGEGIGRIVFGAIPGILLIKGAGWI